jgi:hypothetical protein
MGARDYYLEVVLPALAERLDQPFPEFGRRRDAPRLGGHERGATHGRLGVRAERVVAQGPAPRGFLVHGGEPTLWTAYVNGGLCPGALTSSVASRSSPTAPASIPRRSSAPSPAIATPTSSKRWTHCAGASS